jgi:hypothetical protein
VRFELPAGRGRKARPVEQALRAERIELADRQGGTLEVTCLIATEINAPAGSKPVCWRLLTNRAVPTLAAAVELLDWYRARWEIELFFLVLKEGVGWSACNWPIRIGCKRRWRSTWSSPGGSTA